MKFQPTAGNLKTIISTHYQPARKGPAALALPITVELHHWVQAQANSPDTTDPHRYCFPAIAVILRQTLNYTPSVNWFCHN